jgi:hypothetical protein
MATSPLNRKRKQGAFKSLELILLLILLFVWGSSDIVIAEPIFRQIEGLSIPPPTKMVDVSDFSDVYRQLAKAGGGFGLYFLVDEFADISKGKLVMASRSARAKLMGGAANEEKAKLKFEKFKMDSEKEFGTMRLSSLEFQQNLQAGQKDVDPLFPAIKLNVSGMTLLEKDFSRTTKCIVNALINSSVTTNGRRIDFTLVYCNGFQRVGTKIIHLTYIMPLMDSTTPTKAQEALESWMTALELQNNPAGN